MSKPQYTGFQLKTLSLLYHRDINAQLDKKDEITPIQGWIINYIIEHPDKDIFQRDLEEAMQIRRSTVSGILRLMEKHGLIVRTAVSDDARLKKLSVTDKARLVHKQVNDAIFATEQKLIAGVGEDELQLVKNVLDKMKKNLEQ